MLINNYLICLFTSYKAIVTAIGKLRESILFEWEIIIESSFKYEIGNPEDSLPNTKENNSLLLNLVFCNVFLLEA